MEEFNAHGTYTVSNVGGYLIELSDDGEVARVKDDYGSDNPKISDWLEIEFVVTDEEDLDDEGYPISEPVIDKDGYNIPLGMVMRIN